MEVGGGGGGIIVIITQILSPPRGRLLYFSSGSARDKRILPTASDSHHKAIQPQPVISPLSLTGGSLMPIIEMCVYNHVICAVMNGYTRRMGAGGKNQCRRKAMTWRTVKGQKQEGGGGGSGKFDPPPPQKVGH